MLPPQTHCNMLQHAATRCDTRYSTLYTSHHAETRCNSLQQVHMHTPMRGKRRYPCRHNATLSLWTQCNTLQPIGIYLNPQHRTQTYCNTLEQTHTHTVCECKTKIYVTPVETLQHPAYVTSFETLQHNVTCCNTLQPKATHQNTLHHTATSTSKHTCEWQKEAHVTSVDMLQHAATSCNKLQQAATSCNTLQHAETHSNSPQLSATHCNTLNHIDEPTRRNSLPHSDKIKACGWQKNAHATLGCTSPFRCSTQPHTRTHAHTHAQQPKAQATSVDRLQHNAAGTPVRGKKKPTLPL